LVAVGAGVHWVYVGTSAGLRPQHEGTCYVLADHLRYQESAGKTTDDIPTY